MISVRVSDVRQYIFCPRVIWYRRVLGQAGRETPKMAQGRGAEEALVRLEERRRLRRYGLEGAGRRFGVVYQSESLGLHGVCDLVLDVPGPPPRSYPVEVKMTRGGVGRHHVMQLTAYAMLIEEAGGGLVDRGFVLLLPEDRVEEVLVGERERKALLRAVEAIRTMATTQRFPPPTRFRSFCPDCEFVNFCGDVL
jgi:CRISPR-associated exonuclease Cas4